MMERGRNDEKPLGGNLGALTGIAIWRLCPVYHVSIILSRVYVP